MKAARPHCHCDAKESPHCEIYFGDTQYEGRSQEIGNNHAAESSTSFTNVNVISFISISVIGP